MSRNGRLGTSGPKVIDMSSGLRAMMEAAETEPLDFFVSLYSGDVLVTGRVAPRNWWARVNRAAFSDQVEREAANAYRERTRQATMEKIPPFYRAMNQVDASERPDDTRDEVTLVDVTVFPAVGTVGTRSGGHSLPIARVPLASVNIWWVVEGVEISGSGSGVSWGFAFPL